MSIAPLRATSEKRLGCGRSRGDRNRTYGLHSGSRIGFLPPHANAIKWK